MEKRKDREFIFRAIVLLAGFVISAAVALYPGIGVSEKAGADLSALGLNDFVQSEITYEGVTREIYWHYELANQTIIGKKYDEAKAHLRIMDFYINIMPFLQRDSKFFQAEGAIRKFDAFAINLLAAIKQVNSNMGTSKADAAGASMTKNASAMCHFCHDVIKDKIREITPYGKPISNKEGVFGFVNQEVTYDGVMHEVYWHYEFCNQMIRANRVDDAKAHLKVMSFYAHLLPKLKKNPEYFKTPADIKNFDAVAATLIQTIDTGYSQLGSGDTTAIGNQMYAGVSKTCAVCHDKIKSKKPVREPTAYGKKISLGK